MLINKIICNYKLHVIVDSYELYNLKKAKDIKFNKNIN